MRESMGLRDVVLGSFFLDLLDWFIASDKAVTYSFKVGGGDAALVEDGLPVCFHRFLDFERERDSLRFRETKACCVAQSIL